MTELLAVFRSRSQAMDCHARLSSLNVPVGIINTPKEANVGCGLSLKIPMNAAARAKSLISKANYSSFYGYMKIDLRGGKIFIRGIGG